MQAIASYVTDDMTEALVCVAGDRKIDCNLMKHQLSQIGWPLNITLLERAEDVFTHRTEFDVMVIDNDFGEGRMTGTQLIQLIRHSEQDHASK